MDKVLDGLKREIQLNDIVAAAGSKSRLFIGTVVGMNDKSKTIIIEGDIISGHTYQHPFRKWFYADDAVVLPTGSI